MQPEELVQKTLQQLRAGNFTVEKNNLDIKSIWYSCKTNNENWKDEFVQDVCAFANIDSRKSHIIFGLLEKKPFVRHVDIEIDEAHLQQIIKSKLDPIPTLEITPVVIEGSQLIVLTIKNDIESLPYFVRWNVDKHQAYIRRGTSTDLCKRADILKIFKKKREGRLSVEIESQAISDIRKIKHKLINNDWDKVPSLLIELNQYTLGYSEKVLEEIIWAVYEVESRLRGKTEPEVTRQISVLIKEIMPIDLPPFLTSI